MKKLILLLQFPIIVFSQQKIKIVDSETSKPIPNARIISNQNVYYSNDDGYILLPENSDKQEISAIGYLSETVKNYKPIISLKPKYQNIDELKIVSIDIKKLLKDVSDNYSKIYYDQPQLYDITIKQRAFENNQMKLLMIADGKFWSKDGTYYPKEAINNRFDNFVQLQIDDLRYLKSETYENKIKIKKQNTTQDNIGDLFLSFELLRTLRFAELKRSKTSGKLLDDNGTEQDISFLIKLDSTHIYKGRILYNKIDKAITHFDLHFNQSSTKPLPLKDEDGVEYLVQLGDGILSFDYYKNGDKYVPSKIGFVVENLKTFVGDKIYEKRSAREIIFKNFAKSDSKGVQNPVKINQDYWQYLKMSYDKGDILLSKEEEEFINEKSNEIQN
ncbi:hypothetical protein ACFOWU_11125 [Epilithonimonas zeae]|uniref:Carboxypeptidase-like regulatory domain-containing protein n=1 Tax=Epilithonimonas zeae TaxID=1416779 RepID=A0A1N6H8M5_9FLAO|nr:hypothetical protein [Epilithonimonas zeae]SIO16171.1 hypothetical protein SAMN05444409_2324 [Epilithonimonas zeae]